VEGATTALWREQSGSNVATYGPSPRIEGDNCSEILCAINATVVVRNGVSFGETRGGRPHALTHTGSCRDLIF
jgi:hypothetical protein